MNQIRINKSRTVRIIASILIALSGSMILSDKLLISLNADLELNNIYGFHDTQTFIWTLTQSLSPILLIIGVVLRPYLVSLSIPFYTFTIQLIWVFNPTKYKIDDPLLHLYALGSAILFSIATYVINAHINKVVKTENYKMTFLERTFDLSIKLDKRSGNDG